MPRGFRNSDGKCFGAFTKGQIPWNKGKKLRPLSKEHREKIGAGLIGKMAEDDHPNWKGDEVGYSALHEWIRRRLPQPPNCEKCGEKKKVLDLANISGKYLRRLDDWEYLCRRCHVNKDGRNEKFIKENTKQKRREYATEWARAYRKKHPRIAYCQRCGKQMTGYKWCIDCRKIVRMEKHRKYVKTYEERKKQR